MCSDSRASARIGRPEWLVAASLPAAASDEAARSTLLFFRGHLPRSSIDTKNVRRVLLSTAHSRGADEAFASRYSGCGAATLLDKVVAAASEAPPVGEWQSTLDASEIVGKLAAGDERHAFALAR